MTLDEAKAALNEMALTRTLVSNALSDRCVNLAATLASMTKKYEDSEKVVKQLQDELTELRPKDLN